MSISIYKKENVKDLKNKAFLLYKEGLSMRQVGNVLHRSPTWVMKAIRELSTREE